MKMGTGTRSGFSKPFAFVFATVIYGGASLIIYAVMNGIQPEPYMDEIFHVPQCQKYCRGLYSEWDPKITTLPGTYVVATAFLRGFHTLIGSHDDEDPCSTQNLRAFNLGVSVINLVLIYLIVGHYSPELSAAKRALSALNIGTFPILYFFTFLFYTDGVSTAFLLLMHYLFLRGRYGLSAFAGGYSVFTRQTNVVWVLYHGMNTIFRVLIDSFGEKSLLYPLEYFNFTTCISPSKKGKKTKRKFSQRRKTKKATTTLQFPSISSIWQTCGSKIKNCGMNYILVGVVFLSFVIFNRGIVVGDKEAHQATLNFGQIGYFALIFGAFTSPFLLLRMKSVLKKIREFPCVIIISIWILMTVLIIGFNKSSPPHPYLLADNRHYTFYIWKRFYDNSTCWSWFVWIPIYILVWMFIITEIMMGTRKLFVFSYVICTALNIVPQQLMEFRYFIPGYLFARLTLKNARWKELLMEFALHMVINGATLFLFLYKPFNWAESTDIQRFMW